MSAGMESIPPSGPGPDPGTGVGSGSGSRPGADAGAPRDAFVTTRWTLVLAAGRRSAVQSDEALAELCRTYWYPLYAYVRRPGRSREDAEDLTQAFFARFLERNYLEGLAAERGEFRAFLLASLKHFLANEWDRLQRQKRGGGVEHLSLDWRGADDRYRLDPPDGAATPEAVFDRQWALALLERVIARLGEEMAGDGKAGLFAEGRRFLMLGRDAGPYGESAGRLGMDEGAVRVAVHRMRRRYRELLRDEIAQTLADPGLVEDELRSLQAALAG
jgi:DNA-directed RNA polymerase specialized sigma24 family protein